MDPTTTPAKPLVTAIIEPHGRRAKLPREHLIKLTLKLSGLEPKYKDRAWVTDVARKALDGFAPAAGEADLRQFGDVTVSGRAGKAGTPSSVVTGVEGSVVWPGRPSDAAIDRLRATLLSEGYRLSLREQRECVEADCPTTVLLEWNRLTHVPPGWYSTTVCGKHDYKTCAQCNSIYVMSSTNSAAQAPSVHCEVCGVMLVEWGSSKVWSAQLVTRGVARG